VTFASNDADGAGYSTPIPRRSCRTATFTFYLWVAHQGWRRGCRLRAAWYGPHRSWPASRRKLLLARTQRLWPVTLGAYPRRSFLSPVAGSGALPFDSRTTEELRGVPVGPCRYKSVLFVAAGAHWRHQLVQARQYGRCPSHMKTRSSAHEVAAHLVREIGGLGRPPRACPLARTRESMATLRSSDSSTARRLACQPWFAAECPRTPLDPSGIFDGPDCAERAALYLRVRRTSLAPVWSPDGTRHSCSVCWRNGSVRLVSSKKLLTGLVRLGAGVAAGGGRRLGTWGPGSGDRLSWRRQAGDVYRSERERPRHQGAGANLWTIVALEGVSRRARPARRVARSSRRTQGQFSPRRSVVCLYVERKLGRYEVLTVEMRIPRPGRPSVSSRDPDGGMARWAKNGRGESILVGSAH
jgi:hypothetical protein